MDPDGAGRWSGGKKTTFCPVKVSVQLGRLEWLGINAWEPFVC